MFRNIVLFPHRLGQPIKGVDKAPRTIAKLLPNYLNKVHMDCSGDMDKNLRNLYNINNNITGPRINIGGDHSMAIGSMAHTLNNYPDCKVVWIDAHADLNTYETSETKNFHGMPLGYLTGLGKRDEFSFVKNVLPLENLMYIGIRDLDPFEKEFIEDNNIKWITVKDINETCPTEIYDIVSKFIDSHPVHVSLDVDGIDPEHIPSTGTSVGDGLCLYKIRDLIKLVANEDIVNVDIAELNLEIGNKDDKEKSLRNTMCLLDSFFK
jgi:arginase